MLRLKSIRIYRKLNLRFHLLLLLLGLSCSDPGLVIQQDKVVHNSNGVLCFLFLLLPLFMRSLLLLLLDQRTDLDLDFL